MTSELMSFSGVPRLDGYMECDGCGAIVRERATGDHARWHGWLDEQLGVEWMG